MTSSARTASRRRMRLRSEFLPVLEGLDERCLLSAVTMLSATEADFQTLSLSYDVNEANVSSFAVDVYRSPDATLDPGSDVKIGSATIDGGNTSPGTHAAVPLVLSGERSPGVPALAPDPANPYVFVVATGPDNITSDAMFQKRVLGLVTHGFQFFSFNPMPPTWINTMAASLKADGYVDAIPFNWSAVAGIPLPGLATGSGVNAAHAIEAELASLQSQYPAGTVFDLHLIGHSRGSAVITQAAQTLQDDIASLPLAAGGYWRLTYLDPHPSHTFGQVPFNYNTDPSLLGLGTTANYVGNLFQEAAQDPLPLMVPSHVAEAQVYHEHTLNNQLLELTDEWVLNPIGTFPPGGFQFQSPATITHTLDVTTPGMSHSSVYEWYQANVVPTLTTANPFVTGPIDAPLLASGYNQTAIQGLSTTPLVAKVNTDNPNLTASNLSATISWGDGLTSPGTIVGDPLTGFFVSGTHTYNRTGTIPYTVTIRDVGGSTAKANGTVNVMTFALQATGASAGQAPLVSLVRGDNGAPVGQIAAFDPTTRNGVSATTGDVNGDGIPDVIAGTGAGVPAQVRVFHGATRAPLLSLMPFHRRYFGGVNVASGDLNGDGRDDIVVTPARGHSSLVKVFSGNNGALLARLQAPRGRGGLAVTDVNGDGLADIVTSTPRGPRLVADGLGIARQEAGQNLARVRFARRFVASHHAFARGLAAQIAQGQPPILPDISNLTDNSTGGARSPSSSGLLALLLPQRRNPRG